MYNNYSLLMIVKNYFGEYFPVLLVDKNFLRQAEFLIKSNKNKVLSVVPGCGTIFDLPKQSRVVLDGVLVLLDLNTVQYLF